MTDLLTWGAIVAAGGSIVAVIRFWVDMGKAYAKAETAANTAILLAAKVELLGGNLAEYKEKAAREFASHASIQVAETRFATAVEGMRADFGRLTERLDRLIERMDK